MYIANMCIIGMLIISIVQVYHVHYTVYNEQNVKKMALLGLCRYFGKIHYTRLLDDYTIGVHSQISTIHAY